MALLKKLQTANQQPLTFGGRGRSGRAPSARAPARGSSADGAMPPKKRGGYSHAHAGGGDATDRIRSHSEASTPSKKCAHIRPQQSFKRLQCWCPSPATLCTCCEGPNVWTFVVGPQHLICGHLTASAGLLRLFHFCIPFCSFSRLEFARICSSISAGLEGR